MLPIMGRAAPCLFALALLGCGPKAEADNTATRLEDSAEVDLVAPRKPSGPQHPPMPETFAGFPRPDLTALDGAWIVDGEIPGERVAWIVEDEGTVVRVIDRRGHERVYGATLTSPCALRLSDEYGGSRSRTFSLHGDSLLLSSRGAVAVAAADGSLLACVGHRTYQIAADGRCRYTTEMLGVWSEPAEPNEDCSIGADDQGRALTIGSHLLRELNGAWVDKIAVASAASRMADRKAAIAALREDPAAGGTSETGSD
jgi:hypothetical protein